MDDRRFNKRSRPALQHKIRVIVGTKQAPIAHGVTIPGFIADQFSGCQLRIFTSGGSIIMESGCKITIHDINSQKQNCFDGMREVVMPWGETKWVK